MQDSASTDNISVQSNGPRVFISYSRRDMAFVDRLEAVLRVRGLEPLVDRAEIYAFEDWWKRIEGLVAQADTVLFVLSPDAVASKVCTREVAFAATLNKRFAPVVARPVDPDAVPAALARLNFVFLDSEAAWSTGVDRLAEALATDIDWIRQHSEYGALALRWDQERRPATLLLRARGLEEAQRWIAARPGNAPAPTEATQALIVASRDSARRRRQGVMTGLVIGLLLALGLSGLAFWQRQVAVANEERANKQTTLATEREAEATRERDRAESALANAKRAADGLIFDLAQDLRGRGLPVALIREVLGRAETLMQRLVASAPDDLGLLHSQAAMLAEFADTYLAAGDTDKQTEAAERCLEISRRLVALQPSASRYARDLAAALQKVGDARLARSDSEAALEAYKESLAILRRLASEDPTNGQAARDLSIILFRYGDLLAARGDVSGSLALYEEGTALLRRVAEADPSSLPTARSLSIGLNKIGDVQMARRDLDGALRTFEESLSIRRTLAAADPLNLEAARDLSLSLEKVGDVRLARGELEEAERKYGESLAIARHLASSDASNALAARDLSFILNKLGDVEVAREHLDEALRSYSDSLSVRRRLAGSNPSSAGAARDLSNGLDNIGDTQLARKDYAEAVAAFDESLAIRRRLASESPASAEAALALSFSLARLGNAQVSAGELDRAFDSLAESLAIDRRSTAADPSGADARNRTYVVDRLGSVAWSAILARDNTLALKASDLAIDAAPELLWLQINRAHALMLLDRIDEARTIYLGHRGQLAQDTTTWEKSVTDDFSELRKIGITHWLMDEIETAFAGSR